jgi:cob(I)alamin adenosyltransferase
MKVYTKKGDTGETALYGGSRVSKDHIRIEAYGTVDELNAYIGLIRGQEIERSLKAMLLQVQHDLFVLGSNLATDPGKDKLSLPELGEKHIVALEESIDKMEQELPMLKNFILPGGDDAISFCHIARCVCRRAERKVVTLGTQSKIPGFSIQYLNRLSDYLFVLSRKIALDFNVDEIYWKGDK